MSEETKVTTAQATDSEQPEMPPELVLEIFNFATPRTQLKMASACKDWYFLLVPYLAKTVFRGQIGNFETEAQFETFWKDELFKAKKLRLVDSIGTFDSPLQGNRLEWLWRREISGLSLSLRYLSIEIRDSSINLAQLFATYFCSLARLDLFVRFDEKADNSVFALEYNPSWPVMLENLRVLYLEGNPPLLLYQVFARCPLLHQVHLRIDAAVYYLPVLARIPDEFISKIWKVEAVNGVLLWHFMKSRAFKPMNVILDKLVLDPHVPDPQNVVNKAVWSVLCKLESIRELRIGKMPSECLDLGFPSGFETIHIDCLEITPADPLNFQEISTAIRDHPGKITIQVDPTVPHRDRGTLFVLDWLNEIKSWCKLEYGKIGIGNIFDTEGKLVA